MGHVLAHETSDDASLGFVAPTFEWLTVFAVRQP
jgi:hypothetical protein